MSILATDTVRLKEYAEYDSGEILGTQTLGEVQEVHTEVSGYYLVSFLDHNGELLSDWFFADDLIKVEAKEELWATV